MTEAKHGRSAGALRFHGPDVRKFLQGQLSNDMGGLRADRSLLAGLHNPQGRVLALLRLVAPATDEVYALLPAELAEATAATLRRYVLRAKLTISVEPGLPAAVLAQLPELAGFEGPAARAQAIGAGMPQVYAATSGAFVAQMLNLDCVGAVSFDKGCYTGQEVIARAHYRGRVKRRMQRFLSTDPVTLAPGQSLTLGDGRSAQVVDAFAHADGRSEFLAVAPLSAAADAAAVSTGDADSGNVAALPPGAGVLAVSSLPLPYPLPQ